MELMELFQPGMSKELTFQVEEQYTAIHIGSGSMSVLATPSMIAFMERSARMLLGERLPQGYSNVGVLVEVRHLAPSPLGASVRVRCEILEVAGPRVTFSVEAWDEQEKIGEGKHQRVVIDEARFLKRVEAKRISS